MEVLERLPIIKQISSDLTILWTLLQKQDLFKEYMHLEVGKPSVFFDVQVRLVKEELDRYDLDEAQNIIVRKFIER